MGKKNAFLEKQRVAQRVYFEEGLRYGRQQIIDMMSLVLRDSKIMGKDTFGKKRLLNVVKGIGEYMDEYYLAWQKDDETDYWQNKLDDALAEAYGPELHNSFYERYEIASEYDYKKGRWKG